jgi:uncharacterized membrane protein YidH (DUF202 family)
VHGDRPWLALVRTSLACLAAIVPLTFYRFVLFLVALKMA